MRRGRPPVADVLTPREWEVWGLLREGLTNAEIAERLGISTNTAKYHVAEILGKLGVGSREEAAAWTPQAGTRQRAWGLGGLAWLGRRWPAGAGGKVAMSLVAAGVAGAFVLALAMLARQDDAGLGQLVWVQGGDLWVRTLPAGEPRRLTSDGGNSFPRWSPSGEWVLYRHGEFGSNSESRVIRADGTQQQRLDGYEYFLGQWKPGEDQILLRRTDGAVVVEDVATASLRVILGPFASSTEARTVLPWWSLDGSRVVFLEVRGPDGPDLRGFPGRVKTYVGLSVVDSDGANWHELVNLGANPSEQIVPLGLADASTTFFSVVPEAAGEAIFDGVELLSVSLAGGAVQDLRVRVSLLPGALDMHRGRPLAVIGDQRESWTGKRIALVDATTGQVTPLTGTDVAALSPQLSADGLRVAYVGAPDLGAGGRDRALAARRIWVMDADGSKARQVSPDEESRHEAPRWSNDGKHILFARLTLERCSPSWTLQLLDVRDGAAREVASGLPRVSTYNERPVIDQIPECDPGGETGSISDTYGNVSVGLAYDWWQPAR